MSKGSSGSKESEEVGVKSTVECADNDEVKDPDIAAWDDHILQHLEVLRNPNEDVFDGPKDVKDESLKGDEQNTITSNVNDYNITDNLKNVGKGEIEGCVYNIEKGENMDIDLHISKTKENIEHTNNKTDTFINIEEMTDEKNIQISENDEDKKEREIKINKINDEELTNDEVMKLAEEKKIDINFEEKEVTEKSEEPGRESQENRTEEEVGEQEPKEVEVLKLACEKAEGEKEQKEDSKEVTMDTNDVEKEYEGIIHGNNNTNVIIEDIPMNFLLLENPELHEQIRTLSKVDFEALLRSKYPEYDPANPPVKPRRLSLRRLSNESAPPVAPVRTKKRKYSPTPVVDINALVPPEDLASVVENENQLTGRKIGSYDEKGNERENKDDQTEEGDNNHEESENDEHESMKDKEAENIDNEILDRENCEMGDEEKADSGSINNGEINQENNNQDTNITTTSPHSPTYSSSVSPSLSPSTLIPNPSIIALTPFPSSPMAVPSVPLTTPTLTPRDMHDLDLCLGRRDEAREEQQNSNDGEATQEEKEVVGKIEDIKVKSETLEDVSMGYKEGMGIKEGNNGFEKIDINEVELENNETKIYEEDDKMGKSNNGLNEKTVQMDICQAGGEENEENINNTFDEKVIENKEVEGFVDSSGKEEMPHPPLRKKKKSELFVWKEEGEENDATEYPPPIAPPRSQKYASLPRPPKKHASTPQLTSLDSPPNPSNDIVSVGYTSLPRPSKKQTSIISNDLIINNDSHEDKLLPIRPRRLKRSASTATCSLRKNENKPTLSSSKELPRRATESFIKVLSPSDVHKRRQYHTISIESSAKKKESSIVRQGSLRALKYLSLPSSVLKKVKDSKDSKKNHKLPKLHPNPVSCIPLPKIFTRHQYNMKGGQKAQMEIPELPEDFKDIPKIPTEDPGSPSGFSEIFSFYSALEFSEESADGHPKKIFKDVEVSPAPKHRTQCPDSEVKSSPVQSCLDLPKQKLDNLNGHHDEDQILNLVCDVDVMSEEDHLFPESCTKPSLAEDDKNINPQCGNEVFESSEKNENGPELIDEKDIHDNTEKEDTENNDKTPDISTRPKELARTPSVLLQTWSERQGFQGLKLPCLYLRKDIKSFNLSSSQPDVAQESVTEGENLTKQSIKCQDLQSDLSTSKNSDLQSLEPTNQPNNETKLLSLEDNLEPTITTKKISIEIENQSEITNITKNELETTCYINENKSETTNINDYQSDSIFNIENLSETIQTTENQTQSNTTLENQSDPALPIVNQSETNQSTENQSQTNQTTENKSQTNQTTENQLQINQTTENQSETNQIAENQSKFNQTTANQLEQNEIDENHPESTAKPTIQSQLSEPQPNEPEGPLHPHQPEDTPSPGPPVEPEREDVRHHHLHHQETSERKEKEDKVQKDRCIEVYPETVRQRQRTTMNANKVDIKNWSEGGSEQGSPSKVKKFLPSVKALRNQFETGKTNNNKDQNGTLTRNNGTLSKTNNNGTIAKTNNNTNKPSNGTLSRKTSSSTSSLASSLEKTSSTTSLNSAGSCENLLSSHDPDEPVEPIFSQFKKVDEELRELMSKPPCTTGWNPRPLLRRLYHVPECPKVHSQGTTYVNIEGYLDKLPSGRKKATFWNAWKRRYFVAKDGVLYYYQNPQAEKPSMKMSLMGGKVETMEPNMVGVDDGGREVHPKAGAMIGIDDGKGHYVVVRCGSRQEAERWKNALDTHTVEDFASQYVMPWPMPADPALLRDTLVIDLGSCSVRAGVLASQATLPQVFIPTVAATDRESRKMIWGFDALSPDVRSQSSVTFPVRPSHKITKYSVDLSAVSSLLQKAFADLRVDPKNYHVQVSVPRVLNASTQTELLRILFDKFGVKGVNLTHQSILALYAYNATSGIVVDVGERMDIVPVIDGYIVDGGVSRVPYGGYRILDHLRQFLYQRNVSLINEVESYIIRHVLENICYCAHHYNTEKARCTNNPDSFEKAVSLVDFFPKDGPFSNIALDFGRFQATEGLFNPDAWGLDHPGLHKLVYKAIMECSMDIRKEMSRSIFLAGGVTQLPGLVDRLTTEIDNLTPPAIRPKVHASPYRYHAAYIGACVLAESPGFAQSRIAREDWNKHGPAALRKWSM